MNTTFKELAKLGDYLKRLQGQYATDRVLCENQWLVNLRQYLSQYDPEVKKEIPDERSHVYPGDTRTKVKGGVAKMMEMMFPAKKNNWSLSVSPTPSIPKDALQDILDGLEEAELVVAAEEGREPQPLNSEQIERAIKAFAEERKDNMQTEIADQLADPGVDYPQMCKKIIRSGYIYGCGVARGPMVRTQTERVWEMNEQTGGYEAKTKTLRRPYPEFVRMWDLYPDLSAKTWTAQEMIFERMVLARFAFKALGKRLDFKKDVINDYLKDRTTGNYIPKTYEAELNRLDKTSNLSDRASRKYEVYRGLGFISGHTLRAAGVEVSDKELSEEVFADLWFVDDKVIKAEKAAFGEVPSDQYHAFIYAEDEDSGLTGVGLPEEVRGSQMSICASTRALMDNMSAIAGPIFEVNTALLPRGRKTIGPIHSFMTIERDGDGLEAQYPAIRAIVTQSHTAEILSIIEMQRQQLDVESNLPAFTMGAPQQPLGEAFRTTSNMSMMMGSANMVTKDTVRGFDVFTTSLIGAMLKWNMEFNPNEELKGDYQAVAEGNLSLVAKEVRGAALDQFISTLSEEDRAMFDMYGINLDRLEARDLPTERLLPREEAMEIIAGMKAAAAQAGQIEQGLTVAKTADVNASAGKKQADAQMVALSADATIQEILSRVETNLANATSVEDKNQLENLKMLLTTATSPAATPGEL